MKKNHSCKHHKINIKDYKIIPFEDELVVDDVINYFLYQAPSISSIHSKEIDFNDEELFKNFIRLAKINKSLFMMNYSEKSYASMGLIGDSICVFCSRFIATKAKNEFGVESSLESILRHLRNAIAHGSVFYYNVDHHILIFDDYNYRNKHTSRIVFKKSDLEILKSLLEKYEK